MSEGYEKGRAQVAQPQTWPLGALTGEPLLPASPFSLAPTQLHSSPGGLGRRAARCQGEVAGVVFTGEVRGSLLLSPLLYFARCAAVPAAVPPRTAGAPRSAPAGSFLSSAYRFSNVPRLSRGRGRSLLPREAPPLFHSRPRPAPPTRAAPRPLAGYTPLRPPRPRAPKVRWSAGRSLLVTGDATSESGVNRSARRSPPGPFIKRTEEEGGGLKPAGETAAPGLCEWSVAAPLPALRASSSPSCLGHCPHLGGGGDDHAEKIASRAGLAEGRTRFQAFMPDAPPRFPLAASQVAP